MMRRQGGYLTVTLCLCLTMMIPLYLALIESARRNGAGLEAACAAEAGLQSTLAEYHQKLAEEFNLFAIDSSYGTTQGAVTNTEAHLLGYLNDNLDTDEVFLSSILYRDFFGLVAYDAEIYGVELLTDGNGSVFRRVAVDAVEEDVGIGLFQQVVSWLQTVELNGLDGGEDDSDSDYCLEQINQVCGEISEQEAELVTGSVSAVEAVRSQGILKLVTEEPMLSTKVLNEEKLVAARMKDGQISAGNIEQEQDGLLESLYNKFMFREYCVRYFADYTNSLENRALDYELEYLVAGKTTDVANLKSVCHRLLLLREASNTAFLMSDDEKQEELHSVATALSWLFLSPELEPVLEGVLLGGWSLAESIYDVKSLLKGGKIPLKKTDATWHYGLQQVIDGLFGTQELPEDGLAYRDYLRVFLMLASTEKVTKRAMNLVEGDLRLTEKNEYFRLDSCYTRIAVAIKMRDQKGREYQLIRSKSYE